MAPDGTVDESLMPDLTSERIREMYRMMVFTRRLDERMFSLQRQGRIGTFARVLGQEGAQLGAAYALEDRDWLVPAFRDMGAQLLRGMKPEHMLQYWSGDERGNIIPEGVRMLPTSIPVGTHMLHAAGIAWAMKNDGEDVAVLTIFGEGATSEGDFSEAMNFAGVLQLPVIFLCQNNQWAISVPYHKQTAACTVAQKAIGYGVPGIQVDGNDIFAVYRATREAVDRARAGDGPSLVEAHTYRLADHTTSDDARKYRAPEEVVEWEAKDPLLRLRLYMRAQGLLDDAEEHSVGEAVDEKVTRAVEAFESDDQVVVLGEDVGRDGGVFRVTEGLVERFGEERVIDTPLAESGIVGVSIGMALAGYRPVAEIQFSGFSYPAYDQLVSHASRMRNRSRGRWTVPMVVRMPYGGGIRALEHHSESMEAVFAHVPGLKVVIPSDPYEAKGLLAAAIADPDPVIFMEPKRIYRAVKMEVPEERYVLPLGEARIVREGSDCTVIAWGAHVRTVLAAAEELAGDDGYDVEVIDVRSLSPFDAETILESVNKTGRAVVVHEAPRTGGFGAEISARIAEEDILRLEAPVGRIGGFDTPPPLAKLEDYYQPNAELVAREIMATMEF